MLCVYIVKKCIGPKRIVYQANIIVCSRVCPSLLQGMHLIMQSSGVKRDRHKKGGRQFWLSLAKLCRRWWWEWKAEITARVNGAARGGEQKGEYDERERNWWIRQIFFSLFISNYSFNKHCHEESIDPWNSSFCCIRASANLILKFSKNSKNA